MSKAAVKQNPYGYSHNPADLAPGESWAHNCPIPRCTVWTQGGRAGLAAHITVCHPTRSTP